MPTDSHTDRCVVLVSGGLDSATTLACARRDGLDAHALAIDYGQRHRAELEGAERVARSLGAASFRTVTIDLRAIGGSALTDDIAVPHGRSGEDIESGIPITYVPARNITFLSIALGLAEVVDARAVYAGVNAVDYSGYPDCRPAFIGAFERAGALATKRGVEGNPIEIRTPLIELTKAEIIRLGTELGVDYSITRSCYDPDEQGRSCGSCDSCLIRRAGFDSAGVPDPTVYMPGAPVA